LSGGVKISVICAIRKPEALRQAHPNQNRGNCAAQWSQISTVPVDLSIKNAPDDVVMRLRRRAKRHRRSLQGELLSIVEAAARDDITTTPTAILAEVRGLGLSTPGEAAVIIRTDRDGRQSC
jgi:antitoxin FitA